MEKKIEIFMWIQLKTMISNASAWRKSYAGQWRVLKKKTILIK